MLTKVQTFTVDCGDTRVVARAEREIDDVRSAWLLTTATVAGPRIGPDHALLEMSLEDATAIACEVCARLEEARELHERADALVAACRQAIATARNGDRDAAERLLAGGRA